MNFEKRKKQVPDTSVFLKTLKGGDVFHFANIPEHDAIESGGIYVVSAGGKDARVQMVNLADGLIMMRDDSHKVQKLNLSLVID